MKLLSYLVPQVIYRTSTKFNTEIKVIQVNGKNQLHVDGIQQTGPYDEAIFQSAFKNFRLDKRKNVHSILMLGLGGGFVATVLHRCYPHAQITCVDIDEQMIIIAKQYFGLGDNLSITCVVSDAEKFILQAKSTIYDLVIIDLFIGDDIPGFVENYEFLASLRRCIRTGGALLINYQSYPHYADRRTMLQNHLSSLFSFISMKNIRRNCFFFAET